MKNKRQRERERFRQTCNLLNSFPSACSRFGNFCSELSIQRKFENSPRRENPQDPGPPKRKYSSNGNPFRPKLLLLWKEDKSGISKTRKVKDFRKSRKLQIRKRKITTVNIHDTTCYFRDFAHMHLQYVLSNLPWAFLHFPSISYTALSPGSGPLLSAQGKF